MDDPAYWYDGSPTVACSEPHTTQTAWVFPLEEPTIAAAEEKGFDCWDKVRLFLSVNPVYWVPWGVFMALPSEQEVADGASWVRCDAIFPESWDFETVRTVRGSVEGVAVDPPEEFWACLDDDPQLPEQPFVPCDQPHQYEQTGTLVILDGLAGVADYPDRDERDAAALDQCRTAVRDEAGDDLAVTAVWDDPRVLEVLPEIAGVCFMYNANGDPLAPRP